MSEFGESSYRRFQQGDAGAMEEIVRRYSDALVRYGFSLVKDSFIAEDIAAETFATLFFKKPRLKSHDHLRHYLYRVAHNKAMDYLRRHKQSLPLEDVENVLGGGDLEAAALRKMRNETVYVTMQKLPTQYREVLQLTYFERFSIEQCCKILQKNSKGVYNLLARAKAALKNLLEKEGITHEDLF